MNRNVIEYLIAAAENYPDKNAFSDSNGDMTFRELNCTAKKVAMQIIKRTNGQVNQPIAVKMRKSKECIAAFMGIIYSGNYYSPIDISMPQERIALILRELNPQLIISCDKENGHECLYEECLYEECLDECVDELAIKRQLSRVLSIDPVYVLFTSGSTGIPKGVVISHEAVIDYAEWLNSKFRFDTNTVFGNQAPLYFDNSVLDIYSALRSGASVYFIDEKLFSFPKQLINFMCDKSINTIFWVPSALIAVADSNALETAEKLPGLQKILFCGEVMPTKQLSKWMKFYKDSMFVNLYGPTEITDVCTYFIVDRVYSDNESLPIGKACENTEVLILNSKNELADIGEQGEICVRGVGVSKGYYNNQEKTKEVFIQNPLHSNYRDIIYRTGDIGKIDDRGNIVYLGRADNQIKYQGHRIELGEIEAAVLSIDGIKRACAVYSNIRNKIVLFVTISDVEINEKGIYQSMKLKVPRYMLPAEINIYEALPLNMNGKIDRVKLKEVANGTDNKRNNC